PFATQWPERDPDLVREQFRLLLGREVPALRRRASGVDGNGRVCMGNLRVLQPLVHQAADTSVRGTLPNAGPGHRVHPIERSSNLGYVGDAASVGLGVDRELLAAVVSAVHDALGGDPLGLYLFGSATLGGLRPASDLDLLAVVERPMTRMQKEVLARGLVAISRRPLGTKR